MNEPLSDERLEEMRQRRGRIVMLPGNTTYSEVVMLRTFTEDWDALLTEVERQRATIAALEREVEGQQETIEYLLVRQGEFRDIVRKVAQADNSDSGVCYQLCRVRWYEAEEEPLVHDAPCVVETARALVGEPAEGEADGEQPGAPQEPREEPPLTPQPWSFSERGEVTVLSQDLPAAMLAALRAGKVAVILNEIVQTDARVTFTYHPPIDGKPLLHIEYCALLPPVEPDLWTGREAWWHTMLPLDGDAELWQEARRRYQVDQADQADQAGETR